MASAKGCFPLVPGRGPPRGAAAAAAAAAPPPTVSVTRSTVSRSTLSDMVPNSQPVDCTGSWYVISYKVRGIYQRRPKRKVGSQLRSGQSWGGEVVVGQWLCLRPGVVGLGTICLVTVATTAISGGPPKSAEGIVRAGLRSRCKSRRRQMWRGSRIIGLVVVVGEELGRRWMEGGRLVCLPSQLAGWLAGWLNGWLVDWMDGRWLVGW